MSNRVIFFQPSWGYFKPQEDFFLFRNLSLSVSKLLPTSGNPNGIRRAHNLATLIPSSVKHKENKEVSPSFLFLECLTSGLERTHLTTLYRDL